ncbi:Lrp/AsnC ligand binding domain-containing protein [Pseudomonas entomophila]|uniref:Lrp/AsnC ligand binding domain-containing protein n=1 Tax=Pseudomonas entomophila TaxID=312306 RepID=UPI0023D83B0C|nr:Lrp/AsnC ligand binding domain-containing protein [Pseudomonas entomophila]MDF0731952.1 Lrp/AsnC ligand binding domain-containing protein [Pseudomonas entomophila]
MKNVAKHALSQLQRPDLLQVRAKFKQAIRNTPEVMSGFYITGDADFMLVVTCRNMEDYEHFTRRFFYENSDIKSFKTMGVMDRVKAGFTLPIEEP